LILLLLAYSLLHRRRVGAWVWYLFIPVAGLVWYQLWTKALYSRGLLWDAAQYVRSPQHADQSSRLTSGLVGLSFLGGCALPMLLFAPFLWNRRQLILAGFAGTLAGLAVGMRWLDPLIHKTEQHWGWIGLQVAIYVSAGILVLWLAIADYLKRKNADSILLALWVLGTFQFAAFLNWTVNARSVLPLIPAAAILLARRLDETRSNETHVDQATVASPRWSIGRLAAPIALSAIISLFIAWGDAAFANSGRTFAGFIHQQTQNQAGSFFFQGHWGFQYYLQLLGARPVEYDKFNFQTGDLMVTPENATNTYPMPPQFVAAQEILQIDPNAHAATMALGAGFYSSVWGPLPFTFGRVPSEPYLIQRLQQPIESER
jgi:hypothetical protein